MSGRDPSTWILCEPGIGRVTSADSFSACWINSEGTAFIGFVLFVQNNGHDIGCDIPARAARWTLWQPEDRRGADEAAARTACKAMSRSFPTAVSTASGSKGLSQPASRAAADRKS